MRSISVMHAEIMEKVTECSELIDMLGTEKIFKLVRQLLIEDMATDIDEQALAYAEVLCRSDAFLAPELMLACFLGLSARQQKQDLPLQFPVTPERIKSMADLGGTSSMGEVAEVFSFRQRGHAL